MSASTPPSHLLETTTLIERVIVLGIFVGLIFGVFQILRPFLTSILFGSILVIATWPLREWFVRKTHSPGLAAALLLVMTLAIIGVPAMLLAPDLAEKFVAATMRLQSYLGTTPELPVWVGQFPLIKERVTPIWTELVRSDGNLLIVVKPYYGELRKLLTAVARAFTEGLLEFLLSLAVATMLWLRGDALSAALKEIGERLGGSVAARALFAAVDSVRGVAYGILGTAAIQAAALTLGLYAAGIPEAGILGFLSLLIAMSQMGVLLIVVWGGAALWLFSVGEPTWAAFMIVWGLLVSTADNLIRPWLMSAGSAMPLILVFIGVFGGFFAFGLLGMFIGPTLLGVFFTLLQAWRQAPPAPSSA